MRNVNSLNQYNNYGQRKNIVEQEWSSIRMSKTVAGTSAKRTSTTEDLGMIIPTFWRELIPGQKVDINLDLGIQFNPFVNNLFHEINVDIKSFFVPFRLIWDDWEKFITGGKDGLDDTSHPVIDLVKLKNDNSNNLKCTLVDYLDYPTLEGITGIENAEIQPSAFPIWAYNKIYNDHFRIPDVQNEIDLSSQTVRRENNDPDYFTRARIFQQRGTVPSIPISDGEQQLAHQWLDRENNVIQESLTTQKGPNQVTTKGKKAPIDGIGAGEFFVTGGGGQPDTKKYISLADHNLSALGVNLNDFLNSLAIMRYQVNNAKVQTRYVEHLKMRFGVYPQDWRLDRPEFLNSTRGSTIVDTVMNTSDDQGDITAQGWAKGTHNVKYEAKEHGIMMIMHIVKPANAYDGGLNRMLIKRNRFDYATPELANIPDRPVLTCELAYKADDGTIDEKIFGYQGIYEEYRTMTNSVCGLMKPSISAGLGSYTLSKYWTSSDYPFLNNDFLTSNYDVTRILKYTSEPSYMYFGRIDLKTALPLPLQSEPADII